MLGDFQKYEVTTKFTFEAPIYPGDPSDAYELAELEEKSVATELSIAFPELDIKDLTVDPIIGE